MLRLPCSVTGRMRRARRTGRMVLPPLALALALCACSKPAADAPPGQSAPTTPPALTTTVATAQQADWDDSIETDGSIAAWQEAIIGSEIGGLRIQEVDVAVGDSVRRGQQMARLTQTGGQADLALQRASIVELEATLASASADAARARRLDRTGAMSTQQIAQFTTAERTARARLDAARARLRSEQVRFDNTRVLAPDDGIVSARAATVGAVTQPGQELFRLIRQSRLEWRGLVFEGDLGRLRPGQPVDVTYGAGSHVAGKVRTIGPTVDPQTRRAIVYVDLPGGDATRPDAPRAGMFARGRVAVGNSAAATLPQSALLSRDGFDYVFVVDGDARVHLTKVEPGRRQGDRVEIRSGLPAGARVATAGVAFLTDGDLVRIGSDAPAPDAAPEARR